MTLEAQLRAGAKVTYDDGFKKERGMVKSLCDDHAYVFVVYHCAGNWDNYADYTAARTDKSQLRKGWV